MFQVFGGYSPDTASLLKTLYHDNLHDLLQHGILKVSTVLHFPSSKLIICQKPNQIEVLPGGLEGIPAGLKRLEAGDVSRVKFIARPQDTP